MKPEKKNLRRISIVVTTQTKGNIERLAAAIGYNGTKSFYSEVSKSDRGKSKYRIERVFQEAEQEAIRAWDAFCEPIRARYGIQIRKENAT